MKLFALSVFAALSAVQANEVEVLKASSFDSFVANQKVSMVEFYAPCILIF